MWEETKNWSLLERIEEIVFSWNRFLFYSNISIGCQNIRSQGFYSKRKIMNGEPIDLYTFLEMRTTPFQESRLEFGTGQWN